MTKLINFLRWPLQKKKLLLLVFLLVVRYRICLWVMPRRFWVNSSLRSPTPNEGLRDWDIIREVADLVRFCGRLVPHATCLTQALAARAMLNRLGQGCSLKVGVDRRTQTELLAHAWIEIDGRIILGDLADLGSYSIMSAQERPAL